MSVAESVSVNAPERRRLKLDSSRRLGIVAVSAVTAVGVLLAWQGWNSRLMNFDYINFIDGADRLLKDGVWPDRGDASSYWAFATPGASLLMVPGMLVFDDPRLYESIASVAMYIGTVFGLFLLARQCFGLTCACLSVVVYALSRNGLFYAGSIYPIGHPFFFVWMAYCSLQWVQRNDGRYLGAAMMTWGLGMYVDMVLAPALFLIPAIWLLYRPRVSVAPLALAALVVAAVWFPYLRFEQTRGFADLKSLVTRQSLQPPDYTRSWCAPSLVVQRLGEPTQVAEVRRVKGVDVEGPGGLAALAAFVRLRSFTLMDGMTFNFDQMAWTPLFALPLSLLTVAALAFVGLDTASARMATGNWGLLGRLKPVGWTLLALSLLTNEVLIARYLGATGTLAETTITAIRALQMVLAVCGLVLVLGHRRIAAYVRRLGGQLRAHQDDRRRQSAAVLALALTVSWLVLVMVVEPAAAHRYFWLAPLQLMFLVAAVTYVPQRLRWPSAATRVVQVLLTLLLLTHPWLRAPVEAWAAGGWSGTESTDLQALDFIAGRLRSEGRTEAAVGYHTLMAGFMARLNVVESRYKVGGELDLYLKQRHGVLNSNQCAEGVSPDDEYVIVQDRPAEVPPEPSPASWAPQGGEVKSHTLADYFDVPVDHDFQLAARFGEFQVLQRPRSAHDGVLSGRH